MISTSGAGGNPGLMKALRAHARGGPEQLTYEDAPLPASPTGGDVRVKVVAAAVTFDELTWPETWESNGVDRTPIIPSHEFSGIVDEIGPDVDGISVGEEVFGLVPFNRDGAAAEYALTPATHLTSKPANVSHVDAAAAVLPALTAIEALDDHLGIAAGQRLLIRGGTGAVGSFLSQFAHLRGIEVTSTVRSAAAVGLAQQFGADRVLVITEDADIAAASFDAAIDAVGAGTPEWLYRAVRRGGRVVTLQEPPNADLARDLGIDAQFFVVTAQSERLQQLATALGSGMIKVAVGDIYQLADGRAAYANRGPGRKPGKTVLEIATSWPGSEVARHG